MRNNQQEPLQEALIEFDPQKLCVKMQKAEARYTTGFRPLPKATILRNTRHFPAGLLLYAN